MKWIPASGSPLSSKVTCPITIAPEISSRSIDSTVAPPATTTFFRVRAVQDFPSSPGRKSITLRAGAQLDDLVASFRVRDRLAPGDVPAGSLRDHIHAGHGLS